MIKYTSAIRQMFFCQRGNADQIPRGKEMSDKSKKWDVVDNALKEKLKTTPKLLELYEQSIEENNLFHALECSDSYREGFQFGVLLGLDVAGLLIDDYTEE